MPRIARKDSKSNFLHIMVQGINKEYIFDTEENINKYKELILKKIDRENIEVLAYCIMNNHTHFLTYCEKSEYISKFMQRLNTSYSRYYNKANNRVGYVFRDRYLSQSILSEEQLYTCVNYIHNNPVKAGMVNNAGEYRHSSYYELLNEKSILTNKGIKLLFGSEKNYKKQLMNFEDSNVKDEFLDVKEEKKSIKEFVKEMERFYKDNIYRIIQDRKILETIVKKARRETDVTIVELSNILGISKSSVENYIKK